MRPSNVRSRFVPRTVRRFHPGLEALEDRVVPATVNWINPQGGDWSVAENWDTGTLPGSDDDVVINVPGNVTVTHSRGATSVRSLTSAETLALSNGSLAIAEASVLNAPLLVSGGVLGGRATLTVTDTFFWTGGTLLGQGQVTAVGGLVISGAATKTLNGKTLDNPGTAVWVGTGNVIARNDARILNQSTGTFLIENAARIDRLEPNDRAVFENAGTLRKSAGGTSAIGVTLNNSGTVEILTGSLVASLDGEHVGAFTVAAGATLELQTLHNLRPGSRVTGAGTVALSGRITVSGTYAVDGLTRLIGIVTFTVDARMGQLEQTGILEGPGTVTATQSLVWTRGFMRGPGRTISLERLTVSGEGDKTLDSRILENAGAATFSGMGSGQLGLVGAAVLNNLVGGTATLEGESGWISAPSQVQCNNSGTIRKIGLGVARTYCRFNNAGTIEVQAGTLELLGGGTSGGTFTVAVNATLAFPFGTHSLTPTSRVSGGGTVQFGPRGLTSVTGSYDVAGVTLVTGIDTFPPTRSVEFDRDAWTQSLTLTQFGGLGGEGTLTVRGLLTWNQGSMFGHGRTIAAGGMQLAGPGFKSLYERTLENVGTAAWSGTGGLFLFSGSTLRNLAGATWDIQNDAPLFARQDFGSITFENAGRVRKIGGTGVTTLGTEDGLRFVNTGVVEITSGTLAFRGDGTHDGPFTVAANARLEFARGIQTLGPTARVSGAGMVAFRESGTTNVLGAFDMSTTLMESTVGFYGAATTRSARLTPTGILTGTGTLIADAFTWTGGTMSGPGRTIVTASLEISGEGARFLRGRAFESAGTGVWRDAGTVAAGEGAVFTNRPGAIFTFQNGAAAFNQIRATTAAIFHNAGTLRRTVAGTATIQAQFNNAGVVDLQGPAGTLNLEGGGQSGGSFLLGPAAHLQFITGIFVLTASSRITGTGRVGFIAGHITSTSGSVTIRGMYAPTGLTFLQGIVNFVSDTTIPTLDVPPGGLLTGSGTVTVTDTLTMQGEMRGSGRTVNRGTLTVPPTSTLVWLNGRSLDNAGTFILANPRGFGLAGDATLNNLAGAIFRIEADVSISSGDGTLRNAGVLRKVSSGTAQLALRFENSGLVDVQAGTLELASLRMGTSSGGFTVAADTVLRFTRGYYQFTATSSITGGGTVRFDHGETSEPTIRIGGSYQVAATVLNGRVEFSRDVSSASFEFVRGELLGAGTLTVSEELRWLSGDMSGPGRTVSQGTLLLDGLMKLNNRILENAGSALWASTSTRLEINDRAEFRNLPGADFEIRNDRSISRFASPGGSLINAGTMRKTAGTGTTTIEVNFVNTGTLAIASGTVALTSGFANFADATLTGGCYEVAGTLRFMNADVRTNAADLVLDGPNARIVNQGGIDALRNLAANTSAGGITLLNGAVLGPTRPFTNFGNVTIGGGSAFLPGDNYTQISGTTLLEDGNLVAATIHLNGGVLAGSGYLFGDIVNAAQVEVGGAGLAGRLTIFGNYTQAAEGVLSLELGDLEADDYDVLDITGQATFDGTLRVALLDSFFAREGDAFAVLLFATAEGRFATLDLPDLGSELFFDPYFDATGFYLFVSRRP